ncbi:beta-N-acetylhexosaminidase [Marinicrinis sediminis]|uniref:Beta-N-acetylhexosaminidase n=1 Tax=Marinicrinis sediminis TaxID=1652465 RepID=A0ABW5R9H9_9BACL
MDIHLKGDLEAVSEGIRPFAHYYGLNIETGAVCDMASFWHIRVQQSEQAKIVVSLQSGTGFIQYQQPVHFYRALGLFVEQARSRDSFQLHETIYLDRIGVMLDCSRNAVIRTDRVQTVLVTMAAMGLNTLMLYTEDTYEIQEDPYFGYMRGRYSREEIRELDRFAQSLGIELIPCIQTLAHLATYLRWDTAQEVKDTADILMVGAEQTYAWIEKRLAACAEMFSSRRIHIGMDEAHWIGRGRYLDQHGFAPSSELMTRHLQRVLDLTESYGMEPMMWSDMYFRMASPTGDYYDRSVAMTSANAANVPSKVRLVYWDYYHENPACYIHYLQQHAQLGSEPIFAGGIWTFNGIGVHYPKTFRTTEAAMQACKQQGIREAFVTLWGDDGAETNLLQGLLGLQLYAEHGYANQVARDRLEARFQWCTGAEMQSFMELGTLDVPPGVHVPDPDHGGWLEPENPSKYALWQDPLLGLFDKHVEESGLDTYYAGLADRLHAAGTRAGDWSFLLKVPESICRVLSVKSEFGVRLRTAYMKLEREQLNRLANETLPLLIDLLDQLREHHYTEWMHCNKPFGWEVLDLRYGGLRARLETTGKRVNAWLQGKVDSLPELDEKRLRYPSASNADARYVRCNQYRHIVTANVL